jgi:hypothetical protein
MGIESIKISILYNSEFYLKRCDSLIIRVLEFPATTPPLTCSCNYSTTTVFIGALRRGLASVDTLYCFDTVGAIILALVLIQTAFLFDNFFATLFAVPSSFASYFLAALARLSSVLFARS